MDTEFDLDHFLPYLLHQAAEAAGRSFEAVCKEAHGITRTQWRVMAHLGKFGTMTARDICRQSHVEKTRVSRAVAALEASGHLTREVSPRDRRAEVLSLTAAGRAVFADLGRHALDHDRALRAGLGGDGGARIDSLLRRLIAEGGNFAAGDHEAFSTPRSI